MTSLFISVDKDEVFIDGGKSLDEPLGFTASLNCVDAMALATALIDASKAAASFQEDSIWGTPNNRFMDSDHVDRVNADITVHLTV